VMKKNATGKNRKSVVTPAAKSQNSKPVKSHKVPQRGFLYQIEFCPNPDCIQIHARNRFPKTDGSHDLRFLVEYEKHPENKGKKLHSLYKGLAKVRGLKSACEVDGYTLQCLKANSLFSWEEILPKILEMIQVHVAGKRKIVEAGPAKHP